MYVILLFLTSSETQTAQSVPALECEPEGTLLSSIANSMNALPPCVSMNTVSPALLYSCDVMLVVLPSV